MAMFLGEPPNNQLIIYHTCVKEVNGTQTVGDKRNTVIGTHSKRESIKKVDIHQIPRFYVRTGPQGGY
jgi:hypothetical protein